MEHEFADFLFLEFPPKTAKFIEGAYRAVEDVSAVSTSERAVLSWSKPTENWFGVRIEISPEVEEWDAEAVRHSPCESILQINSKQQNLH